MSEQLELPFDPPLHEQTKPRDRAEIRAKVLRTAETYVTKDRADEHGDMEDNFSTIATYWSGHLGTQVTAVDVAIMMALLKIARLRSNAPNFDNWVDGCGYLACGGELTWNQLQDEEKAWELGG